MSAINGLSVGRSWTANIFTQFGEFVIPTITMFEIHATPVMDKSIPVDGNIRYVVIPSGFTGSIEADRSSDVIEQYWTNYESAYYQGENLLPSTITQTITEPDGSITQMIARGVMFEGQDFGNWVGNSIIKQRLNFYASRWENLQ